MIEFPKFVTVTFEPATRETSPINPFKDITSPVVKVIAPSGLRFTVICAFVWKFGCDTGTPLTAIPAEAFHEKFRGDINAPTPRGF
jgi:hypothetical protein